MTLPRGLGIAACLLVVAGFSLQEHPSAYAAAPAVTVTFNKGTLRVTGTSGADTITVSTASGMVTVRANRPIRNSAGPVRASKITTLRILGGSGNDTLTVAGGATALPGAILAGGNGADTLTGGPNADRLDGGAGPDTYVYARAAGGDDVIAEAADQGKDTVTFAGRQTGVTFDLSSTDPQTVDTGLTITLTSGTAVENVVGGAGADTLTSNELDNTLTGGAGADTFVSHGPGENVDTITDFDPPTDQVSFPTVKAVDLDLDATGSQITDRRGPAYGFTVNLVPALIGGGAVTSYGSAADGATLVASDAAGGYTAPASTPLLLTAYAASGVTLGGAGGDDRIVDRSPNGNSLVGRDGQDTLIGGAGDDTLQGDRGFGTDGTDQLTGGPGADTFVFGVAFGGGGYDFFGDDVVEDFGDGADTIELAAGLHVDGGMGSPMVRVFDASHNYKGSISSANGHDWTAADFS